MLSLNSDLPSNLSVAVTVSASGDQTLSLGDEGGIAPEGLFSLVESCLQIPGMGVGGGGPGSSQGINKGKEQQVRIQLSCMAMSNPGVRITLSMYILEHCCIFDGIVTCFGVL